MIVRDITERSVWSPLASETIQNPLFTILLSVAADSSAELLDEAIQSVLAQKVSDLELIVIDDSQSSEIHAQIDQIANNDFRVRHIRHPRSIGIKAIGLLEGMRAASGEYILLLNATGTLTPNSLGELKVEIQNDRFLVGCGKIRLIIPNDDGRESEKIVGSEPLSQVYLKSVDFLPETGIVLHKSVPKSVGYIDPHFVLANFAVLDYWKRLSRSYEIKRLDVTIGTETPTTSSQQVEFGTQLDTMLYREWCKISRNQLLTEDHIDRYNVQIKRSFSMIADLEFAHFEEVAAQQWWFEKEHQEVEPKKPFIAANGRHGKIHLIGHDITASTSMPFGHFEDEFFHPMAFRHLTREDLVTSQAVILSRSLFDAEALSVITSARNLDVPLFYYFDDNFEVLGKSFSAYAAYTTPRIREQLKDFRGILVPNQALFDYCVQNRWHDNVMMFPPTVGPRQWFDDSPLPPKPPGTLRVIFLGGSHRSGDFNKFVLPAIASVHRSHPIELIVVGDHRLDAKDLGGVKLYKFPYEVSYELTISRLIDSEIDIIVHAGSESANNPYKTPNALMNAWELGAVAVVSDQAPYLHVEDSRIALVAKADSVQSWRERIMTVAENPNAVETIKHNLDLHIKAEYAGTVNASTIDRMLGCLRPVSYPMIHRRYRNAVDCVTSPPQEATPSQLQSAPTTQILGQNQRPITRDDILHKGFTRLYSEILYQVVPDQDNWDSIAFRIGTFNQQAHGELKIRIYADAGRQPLVTQSIDLLQIADNQRVQIHFDPIQRSANRSFRVRFSRETTRDMPRIAIYEEVARESAIRRILRRRGLLRFGRKLACSLTYASRKQEPAQFSKTSDCT